MPDVAGGPSCSGNVRGVGPDDLVVDLKLVEEVQGLLGRQDVDSVPVEGINRYPNRGVVQGKSRRLAS